MCHAVQLQAAVKVFGMRVANCVKTSSVLAIRPSCSSVDGQDHQGATSLGASGADRSSASSSPWRCCRATTGSRSGPLAEPRRGSPSQGFAVSASAPPCRRQIHEMASIGKDRPVFGVAHLPGCFDQAELLTRLLGGSAAVMPRDVTDRCRTNSPRSGHSPPPSRPPVNSSRPCRLGM